jgi:hypothetical protein
MFHLLIYRVTVKSCIHLFCLYILCLKEHRKNITARLKLRFWSLCSHVINVNSAKNSAVASKWRNRPFFTFSEIFWRKEMENKFHLRPTFSTKPAQNLSTVTLSLFNSLKHVLCAPCQPSFDMFLSWLIRVEFRAKMRIKNPPICLNLGEKSKTSIRKQLILASRASWTCSSPAPSDLQPEGRGPRPQSGLVPPGEDLSQPPGLNVLCVVSDRTKLPTKSEWRETD